MIEEVTDEWLLLIGAAPFKEYDEIEKKMKTVERCAFIEDAKNSEDMEALAPLYHGWPRVCCGGDRAWALVNSRLEVV